MGEAKELVDQKIAGKKVMVFSKSFCPDCLNVKKIFKKYLEDALSAHDYEVLEIEALPNCGEILEYLQTLTGDKTLPRVFINQKFIGSGELEDLDSSDKLKTFLTDGTIDTVM